MIFPAKSGFLPCTQPIPALVITGGQPFSSLKDFLEHSQPVAIASLASAEWPQSMGPSYLPQLLFLQVDTCQSNRTYPSVQ